MGLYRVEALVLRSRDMGEADRLLTLYARAQGKLRAVARGSRRPRSRLMGATQPLCHGRFLLMSGRELETVTQAELVGHALRPLREDLLRMAVASLTAELVDALVEERAPSEALFEALLACWHNLAGASPAGMEGVLWWFELRLLDLLGYAPVLDRCVACRVEPKPQEAMAFSPQEGGCLCSRCRARDPLAVRLSPRARSLLVALRRMAPTGASRVILPRQEARMVREALGRFIEGHLGAPLKAASLAYAFMDQAGQQPAGEVAPALQGGTQHVG